MRSTEIELDTAGAHFVDLTDRLVRFVEQDDDGLLNVFVPHATAPEVTAPIMFCLRSWRRRSLSP